MRGALIALVAVLAGPALAQEISVRSGEHAEFSRLVFDFGAGAEWRLGRTDTGYALEIGGDDTRFALGDVYRLIPRTRIADLAQDGGRLDITLGCLCHATVLEVREGLLAIDIRDGAPPEQAAWEQPFDSPAARAPEPAPPAPPAPPPPAAAARAPVVPADAWPKGLLALPQPLPPPAWPLALPAPDEVGRSKAIAGRVEEAQNALLEQLSRAAAQGLVEARINSEIAAIAAAPEAPAAPAPEPPAPPASFVDDPQAHLNIQAITAIDRDRPDAAAAAAAARDAARCIDDSRLAVGAWGDDRPAAEQISDARRHLLGEFDLPDPAAVVNLAQVYLHFGFGAEAAQTLNRFDIAPQETALLRALAEIMDRGALARADGLREQLSCPGAAAFWAAMASDPLPPDRIDTAAVIRTFSALPLLLRRHLGPTLAERFLKAGDGETARALRDAIARSGGEHGAAFTLMEARIDLDDGADAAARDKLGQLAAKDDQIAPEALISLLQHLRADGRAAPDAQIDDAAAQGFAHRRSALGARLTEEAVLSRAARGEMAAALAALQRARQEQADPERRLPAVVPEVLRLSLAEAPDAALIEAVFAYPEVLEDARGDAAMRRALARRLLDAGLAPVADRFISQGVRGRGPEAPEDRMLLAEIRLAEGELESALTLIEELQGDAAALLRARILSRREEYGAALAALPPAASAAERAAYARRAGAWDAALDADPAALQAALPLLDARAPAAVALPPAAAPSAEPPGPAAAAAGAVPPAAVPDRARDPAPASLAAGRSALGDSRSAREAIAKLLASLQLDENGRP